MRIESSSVNLSSYTQNIVQYQQQTSMQIAYQESVSSDRQYNDFVNINTRQSDKLIYDDEESLSPQDKINKLLIEELLKRLFGDKRENSLYPKEKFKDSISLSFDHNFAFNAQKSSSSELSWGARVSVNESYYEKQTIDFKASAVIKTANMDISVDINFSFSQEFYMEYSSSMTFGNASLIDPLVINYGDDTNGLDNISNLTFLFDLDNDGKLDDIPLLKKGSGFLALDKNENGIIDNGSELFGPKTSKGFEELKQYDSDKNNWIDENDYIFNSLKIWQMDESGNNNLIALSEAGIGAIYLANITSEFNYKRNIEESKAVLTNNSIYLKENGKAGLVSEVKMVV
ncbi:MAG: hypothetical protein RBR07_06870 [Arcobacteraceae bacterium]|nr:hypothetical protein [Arcobacteraceae bacterium]